MPWTVAAADASTLVFSTSRRENFFINPPCVVFLWLTALPIPNETLVLFGHGGPVSFGIEETILGGLFPLRKLFFHVVVAAVRAEEDVAWQLPEHAKRFLVVLGNIRILGIVHQLVSGIHVGTPDDHDVVSPSAITDLQRPGRAALGVPRRQMRR